MTRRTRDFASDFAGTTPLARLASLALLATLVLAACGTDGSATPTVAPGDTYVSAIAGNTLS